jgi:hemolysin activation/secretion protein
MKPPITQRLLALAVLAALAALAAFVALAPSAARAQAAAVVAAVRFEGLVHVREEPVRRALTLKVGDAFDPERVEADRKALLALGYFRSVTAAHRNSEGTTSITFRMVEWPRVAHVRVVGNTVVERSALMERISTRVGQVLCAPQLQDDVRAIERLYRDRGYVARVSDHLLDEAVESGILRFEIVEYAIGEVEVEGGTPDLRERARRALTELPPELYRPEAVAADQRRLLRVRGVRTAAAGVTPLAPGKVRIRWVLNADPPE